MGMFDYVQVKAAGLLPGHCDCDEWQTKDFDEPYLDTYIISSDGRLLYEEYDWELVPEEERPYFGKPEWPNLQFIGSLRRVNQRLVDMDYEGSLEFHGIYAGKLISYVAHFEQGQLQKMELLPNER